MTLTHLHLLLNHVPILGTLFAGALLAIAVGYRSAQFQRVALLLLVVFALTAIPVYLTGTSAEELVERAPTVSERTIDRHEDAAGVALAAVEVLGAGALLGLVAFRKAAALPASFTAGLLGLALVTTGLFGWTSYLGGRIRHSEIVSASLAQIQDGGPAHGERGHRHDD